jgi:HK97 family phage portal protein
VRAPWKRAPSAAQAAAGDALAPSSALGGGGPQTGIGGDWEGFLDLWRRRSEQAAIDAGGFFGLPGGWAPFISEHQARQVPALTAGMNLISGIAMQLPLRQKRGDEWIDPPATIVQNPSPGPNRTIADFVDEYANDVLLYGNHASLIGPPDSTGWPAMLIPLDVTQVSVGRDERTLQPIYALEGVDDPLPADRIFHVALNKRSGELAGRGVLAMPGALGAALAADAYAGRYFSESAVPSGVITDTRPNLTQEQADELKAKWRQAVSGTRAPVVISGTTSFAPLATDADKAQLVQARQWDATTVAMALGVPPFLLGIETQRHTYTNAENEFGRFIATTIMRLLSPLEQQISLMCLPRGNTAEFWTGALLRADTATRVQGAVALYAAGLATLPEAREFAGLPKEGGPAAPPAAAPVPVPSSSQPAQLALVEG